MNKPKRSTRAERILRALNLMFEQGQVVELRALGVTLGGYTHKTVGGYFDDFEELAREAANFANNAVGIYVTLNPPHPRLLGRSNNRVKLSPQHTTKDNEIIRRTRLLIDCDAVRFSGIPSIDSEHTAALERADEIAARLSGHGWPKPLKGDSGNGAHLIYAIDLPTNDGGLVRKVLESLAFQFDDDQVKVDTTVYNPARITRLFGTRNRKGDEVSKMGMIHRDGMCQYL